MQTRIYILPNGMLFIFTGITTLDNGFQAEKAKVIFKGKVTFDGNVWDMGKWNRSALEKYTIENDVTQVHPACTIAGVWY